MALDLKIGAAELSLSVANGVERISGDNNEELTVATVKVDPVTGGIEIVANGAVQPYVGIADRHRMLNDQPYGITRAVKNPGKLVARFVDAEITVNNGAPAHADHTGYDASGNKTGIVSITGQPNLLKVTPAADTTEGIRFTTFGTSVVNPVLNGKIGMWVYVANAPGYEATGAGPAIILKLIMTTEASGATTNAIDITFSNQVREGWNFLTFVQRNPLAYQTGGGATEYHPYGIVVTKYGDGTDGDIVNKPLTKIIIQWFNAYDASVPCVIYFDSLWTGWETQAQVILGCDACEDDVVDYVLPIFDAYGWVGYIATPARVWTSGSKIIYDMDATDGYLDLVRNGPALRTRGWDFINHTTNHLNNSALTSAAELAYEIKAVQAVYSAAGMTKGNEFYASPVSRSSRLSEKVFSEAGIKLQRHAIHSNNTPTPWGIDNIHHIGASGAGSGASQGYSYVSSGVPTSVTGLQINSKLRILTDVMIDYGATWFPFWHYVTTIGDSGSGEDLTGDPLYMTVSAFTKWCEYIRAKEIAGDVKVCKGVTGFYYGIG